MLKCSALLSRDTMIIKYSNYSLSKFFVKINFLVTCSVIIVHLNATKFRISKLNRLLKLARTDCNIRLHRVRLYNENMQLSNSYYAAYSILKRVDFRGSKKSVLFYTTDCGDEKEDLGFKLQQRSVSLVSFTNFIKSSKTFRFTL